MDFRILLKYDFYNISWNSVDNWRIIQRKHAPVAAQGKILLQLAIITWWLESTALKPWQWSRPVRDDDVMALNPENTTRSSNAGSILVHRLRRWPSGNPALGQRLLLSVPSQHDTLNQCWFNVVPSSVTLAQHWTYIGSLYCFCW